ncbi:hypothetical protein BKA65DRAFT_595984 [Rhexocercosporidium sp. MPI-PUGE-AT-0058]|nr:hypothetical protein BKA65DRAFT_595984 [Rhexocercosporidium sp. MPI-PUGE-AT-0058]
MAMTAYQRSRVGGMGKYGTHGKAWHASLCSSISAYLWLLGIVAPHSSQTPDQSRLQSREVASRKGGRRQGREGVIDEAQSPSPPHLIDAGKKKRKAAAEGIREIAEADQTKGSS